MKNRVAILIAVVSMVGAFALSGCVSHYDYDRYGRGYYRAPQYGYNQGYRDPFRVGYDQGFEIGLSDRRYGRGNDYDDYDIYRRGISSNPYINDQFRDGFAKGYKDGYRRGY